MFTLEARSVLIVNSILTSSKVVTVPSDTVIVIVSGQLVGSGFVKAGIVMTSGTAGL